MQLFRDDRFTLIIQAMLVKSLYFYNVCAFLAVGDKKMEHQWTKDRERRI